jgi:hypothetical protein
MATNPLPRPERKKGFTQFPNYVMSDWPRLASGDAQVFSLMYIVQEGSWAGKIDWTRSISTEELAQFGRCTVRAIQIAIDDLVRRGVVRRKKAKGGHSYFVPFEEWPALPDRPPKVVPITGEAEETAEDVDEPAETLTGKVLPVYEKPQRVRGGARPRAKELPAPAAKLRLTSNSDIEFTAHMCDGHLNIDLTIPREGEGRANGKRNEFRNAAASTNSSNKSLLDTRDFEAFDIACKQARLPMSSEDRKDCLKLWGRLAPEEKAAAVFGLIARSKAGEYDNPKFRPVATSYLQKRHWERALRKAAGKEGEAAASRERILTRLSEMEQHRKGRS